MDFAVELHMVRVVFIAALLFFFLFFSSLSVSRFAVC